MTGLGVVSLGDEWAGERRGALPTVQLMPGASQRVVRARLARRGRHGGLGLVAPWAVVARWADLALCAVSEACDGAVGADGAGILKAGRLAAGAVEASRAWRRCDGALFLAKHLSCTA